MKLVFVSPPFGEKGQTSKGLPIGPPVLEYMAGLTRQRAPDIEVALIDANKEPFDQEVIGTLDADVVAMTVLTPQAPWVYRTADALRQAGKKVILGGIHISALPEEAAPHADALVVGEAETVWGDVLADAENDCLKASYHGHFPELIGLPHPVTDLWNTSYVYGYFQTSRGCPHRCSFCSVHEFFGGRARMRPIDDVIEELAQSSYKLFWGIDDNIWGLNVKRSIELYKAMSEEIRGKWWFGSGDLVTLDHSRSDELLRNARRAGLTAVMVGWESNSLKSLEEYGAVKKQGSSRRDTIKRIRDQGIEVMLFIMVGGRQDTRADIEGIAALCDELKISAHPVMTTPFPGTKLIEQYKDALIPGIPWDEYDGNHAVYEHPTLSVVEREDLLVELRAQLFSLPQIFSRVRQVGWRGFPMSHMTSFMIQYPQGRAFREYAVRHRQLRAGDASQAALLGAGSVQGVSK